MPYRKINTQTICKIIWFVRNISYLCTRNQVMIATISRSGAVVARWAHNPKVIGSSPVSATTERESTMLVLFFLYIWVHVFTLCTYLCNYQNYTQKNTPSFLLSSCLHTAFIFLSYLLLHASMTALHEYSRRFHSLL